MAEMTERERALWDVELRLAHKIAHESHCRYCDRCETEPRSKCKDDIEDSAQEIARALLNAKAEALREAAAYDTRIIASRKGFCSNRAAEYERAAQGGNDEAT